MVTGEMLDNAIEIAKEEITDPDNPTKDDLRDFRKRLNGLVDKLIEDVEPDLSEDE